MSDRLTLVENAQSALFVPGHRNDRYARAAQSGADVIIVDLEDAVPEDLAVAALDLAVEAIASGLPALVRMNDVRDERGAQQLSVLSALARRSNQLLGVIIAKADDAETVTFVASELNAACEGIPVVPLIESATSLRNVFAIAQVPGVVRLALGGLDLAADIGAEPAEPLFDHARLQLAIASRSARITGPLDTPSTELGATDLVETSTRHARTLGVTGRLCVHPLQIAAVHAAFTPSEEEIEWAIGVCAAPAGASSWRGHMIDPPVVLRAQRILTAAARRNASPFDE